MINSFKLVAYGTSYCVIHHNTIDVTCGCLEIHLMFSYSHVGDCGVVCSLFAIVPASLQQDSVRQFLYCSFCSVNNLSVKILLLLLFFFCCCFFGGWVWGFFVLFFGCLHWFSN